jgi:cohesin loading factor subunit SCC2
VSYIKLYICLQLFKPKEDKDDSTKVQVAPPKSLLTACKQIVDCLIEKVLSIEESSYSQALLESSAANPQGDNNVDDARNTASQRLVACLTTLYLLAKIRPQLLIDHATTLQPYLSLKCKVSTFNVM